MATIVQLVRLISLAPRRALHRQRLALVALAALALPAMACAFGAAPDPDTRGVDQAFSETCGSPTLTANRGFAGKIDPTDVSVRTYNKCTKSWVVDLISLAPEYAPGTISVTWADTPLATAADCDDAFLAAILFEYDLDGLAGSSVSTQATSTGGGGQGVGGHTGGTGGPFWLSLGRKDSTNTWLAASGTCSIGVSFQGMTAFRDYRIAATARVPDGSTRKVGIATIKP